jgi:hypothetical protein
MLLEEDILLRVQESDEEKRVKLQPEDMKLCVKKKSNRRQTVKKGYDIHDKGEGHRRRGMSTYPQFSDQHRMNRIDNPDSDGQTASI